MDTLGKRIRSLREKKGLNQSELAHELGLESPMAVSKYEKDQREPDVAKLIKVSDLFGVSMDWLLTGEGPVQAGAALTETSDDDFVFIPQVRGEISAGEGSAPDDVIELKIAFAKDWIKRRGDPKNLSLIRIRGDSMEPTLRSGDLVLVDHNRNYLDPQGGIYAVVMDDLIMIKRVQVLYPTDRVSIISDNPQYESIEIKTAEVRINGKIIWFGRELER